MKDSDVRGLVLQKLYDLRHKEDFVQLPDEFDLPGLDMKAPENLKIVGNVGKQLNDLGLIKFKQFMGHQHVSGYAAITAFGVDVIEGSQKPPISITIDSSVNVHGSQGVQIGGQGNVQNVALDVGKLINAIDGGTGTVQEKEEAKSLLKSPDVTVYIMKALRYPIIIDWRAISFATLARPGTVSKLHAPAGPGVVSARLRV